MQERRPPRDGRIGHVVRVACVCAMALVPSCASKLPPTPESPTAAVVGSRTITLADVDDAIKDQLFEQRFPPDDGGLLFEAREATLDRIVDAEVVAQAAAGSGLAPAEWLSREAERRHPVSEEDVDGFWQEYEDRLPKDRPVEELRADIREYLATESAKEVVFELRREARVRMVLARPRYRVEGRGEPRGPADAPITIVEFSDFQCPYCLRVSPTIQQLLARFPNEVRLYYRHLPLPSHPRARPAAIAAVCAGQQGGFWPFHDVLFQDPRALGDDELRLHAEQIGLDVERYDACIASPEAAAWVDEDIAAAEALGVTGTPVFFVNGVRLKGAQPLSKFVRVVDEELAAQAAE